MPIRITTTSVSTVRTKRLDQLFRQAPFKWMISLVSASLWLHGCIYLIFPQCIDVAPYVTMIYFPSGKSIIPILLERNANNSCLLVGSCKKSDQFLGSLVLPATFLRIPFPHFSLVELLILLGRYMFYTTSTCLEFCAFIWDK